MLLFSFVVVGVAFFAVLTRPCQAAGVVMDDMLIDDTSSWSESDDVAARWLVGAEIEEVTVADDFDFEALAGRLAAHWGETGGTPKDKDGEIRVRTGKLSKRPWLGRGAATGAFCRGYVENKGDGLAPQVGFEPTTLRLTATIAGWS